MVKFLVLNNYEKYNSSALCSAPGASVTAHLTEIGLQFLRLECRAHQHELQLRLPARDLLGPVRAHVAASPIPKIKEKERNEERREGKNYEQPMRISAKGYGPCIKGPLPSKRPCP